MVGSGNKIVRLYDAASGAIIPPHRADPVKVLHIRASMARDGWRQDCSVLVGYTVGNTIQLLSGSHRFVAAKQEGILIPLVLWAQTEIQDAWGDLDKWHKIMSSGDIV